MGSIEHRRFSEVLAELIASTEEVTSLAQSSETERQVFSVFAILVDKFVPILNDLIDNIKIMEHPPVQKAVESLGKELNHAKAMIRTPNTKTLLRQAEDMVHDLGRSLGLVLFANLEVCTDFKDKIGALLTKDKRVLQNSAFHYIEYVYIQDGALTSPRIKPVSIP